MQDTRKLRHRDALFPRNTSQAVQQLASHEDRQLRYMLNPCCQNEQMRNPYRENTYKKNS